MTVQGNTWRSRDPMVVDTGRDRWRAAETEIDITGMDESSWLIAAVERAMEGYIVPLTVNGVPVAWVVPPRPEATPAIMRQLQAERVSGDG